MHRASRYHAKTRKKLHNTELHKLSSTKSRMHYLLKFGVLAPSTHNTQPWLVKLDDSTIEIHADYDKRIPEADPVDKYLLISVGAFIRNIELAAEAHGIRVARTKIKLEENESIVKLIFKDNDLNKLSKKDNKLLKAISDRQNYRGFFKSDLDTQKLKTVIRGVNQQQVKISLIDDKEKINILANLTAEGIKHAYRNDKFRSEIASLINHNLSSKRYGLHGYSLRMTWAQSFIVPKVMKRKNIGEKLSELNYASFISAPAVIVLSTSDTQEAWLSCGEMLQELLVKFTQNGMSSSIYVAALELPKNRIKIAKIAGVRGKQLPQILFCVGEPTDPLPYSARKKLQKVSL